MKARFLLVLIVPALVACRRAPPEISNWEYRGQLHDAIAHCDRMVVRDDGFLSPRPVAQRGVLFEITNPAEIGQVIGNLHLRPEQRAVSCACPGYPGIDWYCKAQCLARTSVQHGRAIRWSKLPGDANLTDESSAWLRQWLIRHGLQEKDIVAGPRAPR